MRLLLVEDEEKTSTYLNRALSESGFTVDVSADGAEGLHYALEFDYDAIILDVMLPGMDGYRVLEGVRAAKQTPVLMLSARGSVDERVKGLRLGADDYLPKPFSLIELVVSDNPRFSMGGTPPVGVQWSSLQEGFNKVPGASEGACSLFLLVKTIPANGERPELRYIVAIDSTPYMGTLNAFTRTLLIIAALGVVIVALLGYIVSKIGLRPVGALSKEARQLAPGDHGQRLNTRALPEELQQLASSFNGVLARQEIAWRQLESFNADVAHELRTPLTNLIGQTQLGLSRRRSHDELEELLGSNLEELERMTSIVNDMLFLSHAHAGEHASQLTRVSLREETLKTAEYVEPSFAEKQLSLNVQGDVIAHIDRRLFHRSLANLLENSARHSPSNSTVTVRLSDKDNQACVEVSNPGDPIAPEHLHRLFERFYRVDTSRARSDTHHGLGLSIVRAVAIMHRGDVFARSENGINTFGLTFAKQPDAIRPERLTSETKSGHQRAKPADKIVREPSV